MPSFDRPQVDTVWRPSAMGQPNADEDFTQLWERHIAAARKEFAAPRKHEDATVVGHAWDEKMDSVVDALELAVQSPHSRAPSSPELLWSLRDDYSETALSSPQGSIWSTAAPVMTKQPNPIITISEHSDFPDPGTPMVEIGGRHSKGKELASYYLDRSRVKKSHHSHQAHPSPIRAASPDPDPKTLLFKNYNSRYIPDSEPSTPITSFRTLLHTPSRPPSSVHVLILTWAKSSRRGDDGQLLSPGLDIETDTVRSCFKSRGYRVQCRLIPEDYPTSAVETILDKFLAQSREDNLLVVYYKGEGCLEPESSGQGPGRMVFSSGFGGSSFYWDDVRDPLMQAPGDLLMILDCEAAPGVENPEIRMDSGLVSSPSTKQLLGVCAPYSMGAGNFMTRSLCRALDNADGERGSEEGMTSVQGLCSAMRQDLRGEGMDAGTVFVTQLGGGQLMDIYLPSF
ncbi:hypothetical protein QBC34DRAFT_358316 [Podospora aff. communis PSN243]|uniref:Raptor N-terminal CASPase-like domain-containing protein n=1 Tax=Podospora aff. communis PSN243 TaxID=3040156 RepID=A0AAV9GAR5_9PEZI|nr:hypothetical protein QBC34DRAFT_358316 [Podospora aff. communis PSN243]